ncbi:MAG: LysE family transporter [Actinomycetota bacterium]
MTSLLLTVAGLTVAALISPGPNFVLITSRAMASGRRLAIASAGGVALGTASHAVLGIAGFGALLRSNSWIFTTAKLLGAGYLFWIGFKSLRSVWRTRRTAVARPAQAAVSSADQLGVRRAVLDGWLTQMSNPKTTLFFLALFTTVVPTDASAATGVAVVATIVGLALVWYTVVATAFSLAAMRKAYRRAARPIDVVFGTLMIALGLRVAAVDR